MFFCENLFHVSCPPCLPHTNWILMAKNTWSPYLEGWIREGEGEALGFLIRRSDQLEQRGVGHAASGGREYFKPADSLQSQISSGDPSSAWIHFLNKSLQVGAWISLHFKWFLVKENDFESSVTQTCSTLKYDYVLLATISIGRPGIGTRRQILYFRCKTC